MSGGTISDGVVTDTVHTTRNSGVATIDTAEGFCATGESAICKPLMGNKTRSQAMLRSVGPDP